MIFTLWKVWVNRCFHKSSTVAICQNRLRYSKIEKHESVGSVWFLIFHQNWCTQLHKIALKKMENLLFRYDLKCSSHLQLMFQPNSLQSTRKINILRACTVVLKFWKNLIFIFYICKSLFCWILSMDLLWMILVIENEWQNLQT